MNASTIFTLAQSGSQQSGGAIGAIIGLLILIVELALIVAFIAGMWKVFVKAGQPGWAAIIPFYNLWILITKVAQRPWYWFIALLIPFVNFVALIIISLDVAKNFGKSAVFAIGLFLLGFIFYPILGFGPARFQPQPKSGPLATF